MNTATVFLLMASVLTPPVQTSAERSTRIYVRTIPPGASVVLDGKELGTTDGLFLVPPGVRTITLEMDGYDPKAERVDVREGWITRVEVRLARKGESSPEEAETTRHPAESSDSMELNVEWALLHVASNESEGEALTTEQFIAVLCRLEEPDVYKILLRPRPGITKAEYQKAIRKGYELTHRYGLWALITPGVEEGTETRAFPPLGMRYSTWRIKDDGSMEFGERPATIETIRENLGSRNAEEAKKLVLLLECPAGSLYEKSEKAIDQAFEWQREFGLAGIGLGITSETRAGRLEDRRVVNLTGHGDGTQMELTARVEKNYNAYARQTWTPSRDEIPAILKSLPNCERRVLEVGFSEEVPQDACQELTKLAATWANQFGFWYCCDLGGAAVLPTGKRAWTPYLVRWVVQDADNMTFEGDPVTLEQLPQLLRMIPNRHATVLELGYDSRISVQMRNEYVARATVFAHQFGFKYASDIGEQKLGSKGSPTWEEPSAAVFAQSPVARARETTEATRTIHLPDADTKDAAVVLDLASGGMLKLPWKTEQEGDARDFTRLGKGDLGFDSELFCLRGGEVETVKDDGSVEPLRVTGRKDDAKIYRLPNIPCQLIVTTAEKRHFVVKVLEKTAKGGLKLEYREKKEAEKAKPPVESAAPEGFEPERRLRIYDDGSKAPCMVDLDTGRLYPRPGREDAKEMSAEQWMASKGIDAGCETNPGGPGLWGMDMIVLPVANDAWENPRAAAIESELRGGKPGSPAIMSALGGLPRTFWFATREGGKGILQLMSQFKDDEGEGFEVRYRLISQPKTPAEVKAQVKVIETAVELYCLDTGSYPRRLEELLTPPKEAKDAKAWSGPYLKSPDGSVPVDPWGNPYQIFWGGKEKERFLGIGSSGLDGKFGTEDDLLSFEPEKGQTPTPAPEADKQTPEEAAENGPGSVLELRICANEEEAKAFEKSGGKDLGWYASVMEEKNQLITREVDGRAEVLLWKTADKSLVAAGPKEKPWRVIKVSVIAEPDKPGRIGVVFDVEGGRRMRQLTAANIDRRLAVLVDGRVVACPIIHMPMGERVEITGNFTKADLNRIATAVQAGMEEKE